MGSTAEEFWNALQPTRKAGYYISKGELEANVCAIATPLFTDGPQAIGALALVIPLRRFEFMNHEKLLELLKVVTERISAEVEKNAAS
jgi:DNA-binding IclR family transcriptional regulator